MQAKRLPLHAPLTPGMGSKCQTIFLTENGHVTYQIKENETYIEMQAIILS